MTPAPWAGRRTARVPAVSRSQCQPCTRGKGSERSLRCWGRGSSLGLSCVCQLGTGPAALQGGQFALSPMCRSTAVLLASARTFVTCSWSWSGGFAGWGLTGPWGIGASASPCLRRSHLGAFEVKLILCWFRACRNDKNALQNTWEKTVSPPSLPTH